MFNIKQLKSPNYHYQKYKYTIDNKKDVFLRKKILSKKFRKMIYMNLRIFIKFIKN